MESGQLDFNTWFSNVDNKTTHKLILSASAKYSVCLNFTYPSKELCTKMALGEVGVSLP